MTYRQVKKKLKKLGCTEIRRRGGGSHRLWRNPANDRAVVRQLGLEWKDFQSA